jgi:hypothetical protein
MHRGEMVRGRRERNFLLMANGVEPTSKPRWPASDEATRRGRLPQLTETEAS